MELLHIDSRVQADGETVVLDVRGFIDTATAGRLEAALQGELDAARRRVIVNLAGVDYVGSAGWGALVGAVRAFHDAGGEIRLAAMRREVREIYRLLEFPAILPAHDDVEDALTQLVG